MSTEHNGRCQKQTGPKQEHELVPANERPHETALQSSPLVGACSILSSQEMFMNQISHQAPVFEGVQRSLDSRGILEADRETARNPAPSS